MADPKIPHFAFLSIEDLREKFEASSAAKRYRLNFKEYALLCRIWEGIKPVEIYEGLYLSRATVCRCRHTLIAKLKSSTFEQALILAGRLDLLWEE